MGLALADGAISDIRGEKSLKSVAAIILAAGSGSRFSASCPKQFVKLGGKPVVQHAIEAFLASGAVQQVVVVVHPDDMGRARSMQVTNPLGIPLSFHPGGNSRQASSAAGLAVLAGKADRVLIHDGARPLVSVPVIHRVVSALDHHRAVDVSIPAVDTVIRVRDEFVSDFPLRREMRYGQTPQGFHFELIREAHAHAERNGIADATDDCQLVKLLGTQVHNVAGERRNLKITHVEDLYLAEHYLRLANTSPMACEDDRDLDILCIGSSGGLVSSFIAFTGSENHRLTVLGRQSTPSLDVTCEETFIAARSVLEASRRQYDALVYFPGLLIQKSLSEMELKEWDAVMNVNLRGAFLTLRHLSPLLRADGSMLFVGSSSYSRGRGDYAAYSASKAGLVNLVQAAAEELPGLRVNVLSPQRFDSPMRARNFSDAPGSLLTAASVSRAIMGALRSRMTGYNFDVRVDANSIMAA